MEMMKTCCSEVNFNLESLSNCNFLNEMKYIYIPGGPIKTAQSTF